MEEKPDYLTRAEWEKEKAEVAARAAQDALEADRRRRQTENARKAAQEKREAEERAETLDVVRATLSAKLGVLPEQITDDIVDTAINRAARKRADGMTASVMETVSAAFEYLEAPAYGKEAEWSDEFGPAAAVLGPKMQALINHIRPQIEENARKGWISEADLPARVEAEIARRNAKSREGQEELKRPEGQPVDSGNTLTWWKGLSVREKQDPANQARYDAYTASLS